MFNDMDLSIVIVNYKTKDKIKDCLKSIVESDLDGLNYELIIVDNASGDDLSDLKSEIVDFKLIKSEQAAFNKSADAVRNMNEVLSTLSL